MRHDAHYVEELSQHRPAQIGRMIPVDKLDPNPEQPRTEFGDLTELTASIAEKGVLEPLLVKPNRLTGRWMIIAGERRWRSAQKAGLKEVPCVEMEVDEGTVAEIALIENMQRKDLTAFEEAEALHQLAHKCGYTHEDMARKLGKSRTSVTESLALNNMPDEVRNLCRLADITSKSTLLHIVRQNDPARMLALVEKLAGQGTATRQDARNQTAQQKAGRPKAFVFAFKPPTKAFNLRLQFTKSRVDKNEIIDALEGIIRELRGQA